MHETFSNMNKLRYNHLKVGKSKSAQRFFPNIPNAWNCRHPCVSLIEQNNVVGRRQSETFWDEWKWEIRMLVHFSLHTVFLLDLASNYFPCFPAAAACRSVTLLAGGRTCSRLFLAVFATLQQNLYCWKKKKGELQNEWIHSSAFCATTFFKWVSRRAVSSAFHPWWKSTNVSRWNQWCSVRRLAFSGWS